MPHYAVMVITLKLLLKNITALSIEVFHNATGGTGQAIRLAKRLSIPVFNLFQDETVDKLQDFVYKTELLE